MPLLPMFAFPPQAEFNQTVPKAKIYAHVRAPKRLQKLFVDEVEEIIWKYKLAPETINLPARQGINEIQVFEVRLKVAKPSKGLLESVDRAVPLPLILHVVHEGQIYSATSYKRPSEAEAGKWVIEGFFSTQAQALEAPRTALPVALDLAALYQQIVSAHIPTPARKGESVRDLIQRCLSIQAKTRETTRLESRLLQEKQFNRKVELNAALRSARLELEQL